MISVPASATDLKIAADGTVTALTDAGSAPERLGQIELAVVEDLGGLTAAGSGYYDNAAGAPITSVVPGEEGGGRIVQSAIEASNVDLSDQMIDLMLLQRSYSANAQLVQAGESGQAP